MPLPEKIGDILVQLEVKSLSRRTNAQRLEQLTATLLNSNYPEPLERLCPELSP